MRIFLKSLVKLNKEENCQEKLLEVSLNKGPSQCNQVNNKKVKAKGQ